MATLSLRGLFVAPSSIAWVLVQQITTKFFFGLKFLLAAKLLGPEQFGMVGVAIAALAIVESLADTGMTQAMIQRKAKLNETEAGAVWTLQLARGFVIALILAVSSDVVASLFRIREASPLIMIAAILPIIRNAVNPGFYVLQRDRNFRAVSMSETISAVTDFSVALVLLESGYGPVAVLFGSCSGDLFRFLISWAKFSTPLCVNFHWKHIAELGRYGLWIWLSSILAVMLNQFDKVIVARWLGAGSFGLYQTSSRLAQLGISDIALAVGQYLFPTMSRIYHEHRESGRAYFLNALVKMSIFSGILSLLLISVSRFFVEKILGEAWLSAVLLIRIQCLSMWIGAMIAVCVAYLRASGRPKVVTCSSIIQLAVLTMPSYWVIQIYGVQGMAWLVLSSLSASFLYMVSQAAKGDMECA